jgi:uncharacterized membrane protein YsdA (DUF1294 family)
MVVIVDPVIFFVIFIPVNGMVFYSFANDKKKALNKSWRTPENTLLALAFIGPFGAYTSMKIFHHKTSKTKFLLVPVFMVVQFILIMYVFFNSNS